MSKPKFEAWAFIRPNTPLGKGMESVGRPSILADSTFESEVQAWVVGLGWPSPAEIEEAKKKGYRVVRVKIEEI